MPLVNGLGDRHTDTHIPMCKQKRFQEIWPCAPGLTIKMCRPHYSHCNLVEFLGITSLLAKEVLQIYAQIVLIQ